MARANDSADCRQVGSRSAAARAPAARRRRSPGCSISRRNARASASTSSGGTSTPALARYGLRYRAGRRADHRQSVGDRLGESHSVALVARRQHEHIGARVQLVEAALRHRARDLDPLAEAVTADIGIERVGGRGIAGAVARDGQPPGQGRQTGERGHQHVVALARYDGADAQQRQRAVAAAGGRRPQLVSRHRDRDVARRRRRNRPTADARSTGSSR